MLGLDEAAFDVLGDPSAILLPLPTLPHTHTTASP